MSVSDDIQFDMAAAVVGVMVVLFQLVYDEAKFPQTPSNGLATVELLFLEDPISQAEQSAYKWPTIESIGDDGATKDNYLIVPDWPSFYPAASRITCEIGGEPATRSSLGYYDSSRQLALIFRGIETLAELKVSRPSIYSEGVETLELLDKSKFRSIFALLQTFGADTSSVTSAVDIGFFNDRWASTFLDIFQKEATPTSRTSLRLDNRAESLVVSWRKAKQSEPDSVAMIGDKTIGVPITLFNSLKSGAGADPVPMEVLTGFLPFNPVVLFSCSFSGESIHSAKSINIRLEGASCPLHSPALCADGYRRIRVLAARVTSSGKRYPKTWMAHEGASFPWDAEPDGTVSTDGLLLDRESVLRLDLR